MSRMGRRPLLRMLPLVDLSVVKILLTAGTALMFATAAQVCRPDVAFNSHHRRQHFPATRPQTPVRHLHRVPAFTWCRLIKQHLVQLHVNPLVGRRGRAGVGLFDWRGRSRASVSVADAPVAAVGELSATTFHRSCCEVRLGGAVQQRAAGQTAENHRCHQLVHVHLMRTPLTFWDINAGGHGSAAG